MNEQRKILLENLNKNNLDQLKHEIILYIKKYPGDYFGYNIQGIYQERIDDYKSSYDSFLKAEELSVDNINIKINIGRILLKLSKNDEAIEKFLEAKNIDKNNFHPLFFLSNIFFNRTQYEEALNYLEKANDIQQNNIEVLEMIGLSNLHLQRFSVAEKIYENLISLKPNISGFYHNLGSALFHQSKYIEALSNYSKALSINPSFDTRSCINETLKASNLRSKDISEYIEIYNSTLSKSIIFRS